MTFSVTPPCRIDPAHPPTLHKYLVQKRFAQSHDERRYAAFCFDRRTNLRVY
jgi:hypothetical protein